MNQFQVQIANLPPVLRAALLDRYGQSPITVFDLPYYSAIRMAASLAGVIDTTTRKAFAYAIGQSPTVAGFAAAYGNATEAETNLTIASQTLNGADVLVYGISAAPTSDSDPALAARVWRETFCELQIGNSTTLPLGRLEMFPGSGGLRGIGQSAIKVPDLSTAGLVDGGQGAAMGFFENGQSAVGNFFELGQPIWWSGVANGVDSTFNILATPKRQITELVAAPRVAAAGEAPFTPPAALGDRGTYVDIVWRLHCLSINKQSANR